VVVDRGRGRVETYAPGLNVIEQRRRVTNWATRDVERIWQPRRRCYDTSTEFLRADYRDQRRGALPREPDIRARLVANGRVIVWLKPAADESPELHGRIRLDRTGRPVRADEASISYPGRVSRPPPGPLCGSG
jgi:hypothetical protein